MNETDRLFLETLKDLEHRTQSQFIDWYETLGISALIRKLFLDDHPLVDQANRNRRLKITFEVSSYDLTSGNPSYALMADALDPDMAPLIFPRQTLNRDQFFKVIILIAGDKRYSIKDVVLFEANIMGGIHAGSPKTEQDRVLSEVNRFLLVHGGRASLHELRSIGKVVLKALTPLRIKVQNDQKSK